MADEEVGMDHRVIPPDIADLFLKPEHLSDDDFVVDCGGIVWSFANDDFARSWPGFV